MEASPHGQYVTCRVLGNERCVGNGSLAVLGYMRLPVCPLNFSCVCVCKRTNDREKVSFYALLCSLIWLCVRVCVCLCVCLSAYVWLLSLLRLQRLSLSIWLLLQQCVHLSVFSSMQPIRTYTTYPLFRRRALMTGTCKLHSSRGIHSAKASLRLCRYGRQSIQQDREEREERDL